MSVAVKTQPTSSALRRFYRLEVEHIQAEADDAISVWLRVPPVLADLFVFKPGQFLTLRATINGVEQRRSYSLCSVPGDRLLRVGIRAVLAGVFSNYAKSALAVGDWLEVMPPEGRFCIVADPSQEARYLLLAAGSGITPILSIARALLEGEPASRVTVLYANRKVSTIMFIDDLYDLKNRFMQRFELVNLLSRETQDVRALNGRLTAEKLDELILGNYLSIDGLRNVFICGPDTMTDSLTRTFVAHGIDSALIRSERFTPAAGSVIASPAPDQPAAKPTPSETGARVEVLLDGVRQSFSMDDPNGKVLAGAQAAGLDLPFSCAGGMCATCRCRVTRGNVQMDVNYSLEPWELERGFVLACQARPITNDLALDFDAT